MQSADRDFDLDPSIPLNMPLKPAKSNLYSLATVWARRYVATVAQDSQAPINAPPLHAQPYNSLQETQAKLQRYLRHASAQAWGKTEALLKDELNRHSIAPELINPWEIAGDVHRVFEVAIQAYGDGVPAQKMAQVVGQLCGQLRSKYTAVDPRVIGFVSMQCHYTGQMLLVHLLAGEQKLLLPYLRLIDDHLYMPLREAYKAAAKHDPDSETLRAVQHLLPVSTRIARKVYKRIKQQNPGYHSYSGSLASDAVRVSSIRDIEMFQIYLCLCLLEGNVRSVQEQLFPVCVMLYPRLHVSWELVHQMLEAMGWEMHKRLLPGDMMQFLPYLRTLSHMFSKEVFMLEGQV